MQNLKIPGFEDLDRLANSIEHPSSVVVAKRYPSLLFEILYLEKFLREKFSPFMDKFAKIHLTKQGNFFLLFCNGCFLFCFVFCFFQLLLLVLFFVFFPFLQITYLFTFNLIELKY